MNTIQAGSFLTLHYRLAGPDGTDIVNTFNDQPATLSLGTGELAPAMEQRLVGLQEGVRTSFDLSAGAAHESRLFFSVFVLVRSLSFDHPVGSLF